jgi:TPR repeat protein
MVVSQNYVEAVKWFRLAADQGNGYAQFNLEQIPVDFTHSLHA